MAVEEPPQRADADWHALLAQKRLELGQRDVHPALHRRQEKSSMGLDPR
jgi:hypothetical protein